MKTEGKALGKLGKENINLEEKKVHVKEKDKKIEIQQKRKQPIQLIFSLHKIPTFAALHLVVKSI